MNRTRRVLAPAVVVALTVCLAASDWPIGWDFWIAHPFIAALVPGLLLIAVAGVLVDAYLRVREARRWREVGGAAAGEFVGLFVDAGSVLVSMLGNLYAPINPEIDYHLVPARLRAQVVLGIDGTPPDPWDPTQSIGAVYEDQGRARLPTLLRDESWADSAFGCLRSVSAQHGRLVAQWASLSAVAGREREFVRMGRTTLVADTINRFLFDLVGVQEGQAQDSPVEAADTEVAIEQAVDAWIELRVLCLDEVEFWSQALRDRAGIESGRRRQQEALRQLRS